MWSADAPKACLAPPSGQSAELTMSIDLIIISISINNKSKCITVYHLSPSLSPSSSSHITIDNNKSKFMIMLTFESVVQRATRHPVSSTTCLLVPDHAWHLRNRKITEEDRLRVAKHVDGADGN